MLTRRGFLGATAFTVGGLALPGKELYQYMHKVVYCQTYHENISSKS